MKIENTYRLKWEQCLKIIQNNVGEETYNAFFATMVYEQYSETGRTLLIQLPSQFIYEYIEDHFAKLMNAKERYEISKAKSVPMININESLLITNNPASALNEKISAIPRIITLKIQLPKISPYAASKFFLWHKAIVAVTSGIDVAIPRNNDPTNVLSSCK